MTVWIVTRIMDSSGDGIVAVFATKKLADDFVESKDNPLSGYLDVIKFEVKE